MNRTQSFAKLICEQDIILASLIVRKIVIFPESGAEDQTYGSRDDARRWKAPRFPSCKSLCSGSGPDQRVGCAQGCPTADSETRESFHAHPPAADLFEQGGC